MSFLDNIKSFKLFVLFYLVKINYEFDFFKKGFIKYK